MGKTRGPRGQLLFWGMYSTPNFRISGILGQISGTSRNSGQASDDFKDFEDIKCSKGFWPDSKALGRVSWILAM